MQLPRRFQRCLCWLSTFAWLTATVRVPSAGKNAAPTQGLQPLPLQLDESTLVSTAERIMPTFKQRCLPMPYRDYGVLYEEGLALLSAAVQADVDILIESGTANGQSTELMARYFKNSKTRIFTIDSDQEKLNETRGILTATCQRLSAYPSVTCVRGDSFLELPVLLEKYKGRRIGVFVDGPKGFQAMKLCLYAIVHTADVKFCSMHDTSPHAWGLEAAQTVEEWGRTTLLSWKPRWRRKFAWMDEPIVGVGNTTLQQYGWGMAIVAGLDAIPYGVPGDDGKKFNPKF
mmetsp:Transcript_15444/g.42573  ORF Transcript_15444/g.42573 Transcript_15444/m.42573 type:complete len:288 (-) Transcript_15444:134-997(-)